MFVIPILGFWALAIWASVSRGPALLYLFFASMAFGAFAVLPPALTGGLTFTATPIVCLLLLGRVLLNRKGPAFLLTAAIRVDRLGLLALFMLVAVIVTLFMPRLFEGAIQVVPFRGEVGETAPLQPTPQNISQLVYLTISVLVVFAFTRILQSRADRQHALKALVFGGGVTVATGLIDFASQYAPLGPVLAPFRTATYSLLVDVEVLGLKRVVGLMPEASAFGGLCLGFLAMLVFLRRAIANARVRNVWAPLVIAGLLACCWLSTSSATYLGVGVLVVMVLVEAMLRTFSRGKARHLYRQDLIGELSIIVGLFVATLALVVIIPQLLQPVYDLIDRMVLQKAESSSFEERGMWRAVALAAISESWGLGVGVGGTRSSSSFISVFSSTGVLGGALFYAFVLQTLLRRSTSMDWEGQFILAGFRFSFIPIFVVGLVVGDANFGPLTGFGFGLVTATVIAHSAARARQRQVRKLAAMAPVLPPPPQPYLLGAPEAASSSTAR